MSTSVRRDVTKFGTDDITIMDATSFAQQIARESPGFLRGWQGCAWTAACAAGLHKAGEEHAAAVYGAMEAKQMPSTPPVSLAAAVYKALSSTRMSLSTGSYGKSITASLCRCALVRPPRRLDSAARRGTRALRVQLPPETRRS